MKLTSRKIQKLFQVGADIVAIWVGFFLQLYIRFFSGLIDNIAEPNVTDYVLGSILMTCFWLIVFAIGGMYKNWQVRSPFAEFFTIVKTVFFGCIIIVFIMFWDRNVPFRAFFLAYFGISTFCFTFFRYFARRLQITLRKRQILCVNTIAVGNVAHCIDFYTQTQSHLNWGIKMLGFVTFDADIEQLKQHNIPNELWLGEIKDFVNIISKDHPEDVIITSYPSSGKLLFEVESDCTDRNINVLIQPNLYDSFMGRTRTLNLYGIPLIEVSSRIMKPYQMAIKRLFDVVFSFVVLVVGLPLWLLVALIIKLESPGKVLYSQPRVGKDNKIFTIYKFRSMTQQLCADPDNPQWTKVGDPRVTKFGKFIRKTHIDEFPQLYNVMIGDMSMVGPRPEQPKFVNEFSEQLSYYNRRHIVRPGITGWWQVKYKSHELNLDEIKSRTKDDFYYIENMSLQLDFEILVRTVWCVLRGQGQT
jgi:exopolysaccharide biosynthesis polyprenyl glycosylphosphotransferase